MVLGALSNKEERVNKYENRLAEHLDRKDYENLAKRLGMTKGNLQRIIHNERELRISEMFTICEFLKIEPSALFVSAEATIATTQSPKHDLDGSIESVDVIHLVAEEGNSIANGWLCDGLQGKDAHLPDVQQALQQERPGLPIVPGRTVLGRIVEGTPGAIRCYSLKREDNKEDERVSRLHLEIYRSVDSPEIIVYLHRSLQFEIGGELYDRAQGECASLTNGDKLIFPNGAVLEVDS